MTDQTFKVEGLKALDTKLAALGSEVGFKTLRSAMMDSTKPAVAVVKSAARATGLRGHDSEAMSEAVGRWTKKITNNSTVLFMGPKNKAKKALNIYNDFHDTNYSRLNYFHLVEFGSVNNPAQPWLRPSFQALAPSIVRVFGKNLATRIEKAGRRNAT